VAERDRSPEAGRGDLAEWVAYLKDIGVRELRVAPRADAASPEPVEEAPPQHVATESGALFSLAGDAAGERGDPAAELRAIEADLGDCTRCRLHEGRTNIVFGVGDPGAALMFIGEGPGADEDAQGEPFVGRAGQKLNEMIQSIGLAREEVYIANVVKCRPPQNRDPKPDEVAMCSPFLFRQIEAIRPRVIVTLGSPATKLLLNTSTGITRLRGTWQDFRGVPVMPTFHPAYLLRAYTRENRKKVWDDLRAAKARADELGGRG
jgi:DNA polymerase